jgi:hypothetical protein
MKQYKMNVLEAGGKENVMSGYEKREDLCPMS